MGVLTEEGIAILTEAFNKADADKSGNIDAGEIEAAMAAIAAKEGIEAPTKENIQKRLDKLPTETPGRVNLKEFLFLAASIKVMMIVSALFIKADKDESGVLEGPEIKNVIVKLHEFAAVAPPPEAKQDAIVKDLGGTVNFEEFAAFMIPIVLEAHGVEIIA